MRASVFALMAGLVWLFAAVLLVVVFCQLAAEGGKTTAFALLAGLGCFVIIGLQVAALACLRRQASDVGSLKQLLQTTYQGLNELREL